MIQKKNFGLPINTTDFTVIKPVGEFVIRRILRFNDNFNVVSDDLFK